MKVLVIGQGGREHAIVKAVRSSRNVQEVFVLPGNAGMSQEATCIPISASEITKIIDFARDKKIDLTIVGPEAPLVAGMVDRFQESRLNIFGPTKAASQIEGSKSFAKEMMFEVGVPTASGDVFTDVKGAHAFAKGLGFPVVVKADGLAAGKGVKICYDDQSLQEALSSMIEERVFGEAGSRVVVEEYLEGEECSILAISDGENFLLLEPSQDHKRLLEGDQGPNTGGMGAYSPVPFLNDSLKTQIRSQIFEPMIKGLAARGSVCKLTSV